MNVLYNVIVHQVGHLPRADCDVISVGQTNICVRISIIPVLSIYIKFRCLQIVVHRHASYKIHEGNFIVLNK